MKFRAFIAESQEFDKQLLDTFGRYKVFKVNGLKVRQASPALEEFGGSSNHYMISAIPQNEIWIEDDVPDSEVPFLVSGELTTIKLIRNGIEKDRAYDIALQVEKDERKSAAASNHPEEQDDPADQSVYMRAYGQIPAERVMVWLVDGKKVRDLYKTDFIEGGHGYVYDFVPNNEIWIEYGLHTNQEAPLILLHEFVERCLMKYRRMPYDQAHRLAAKVEFRAREHQRPTRHGILSLTKDKALGLIKNLP